MGRLGAPGLVQSKWFVLPRNATTHYFRCAAWAVSGKLGNSFGVLMCSSRSRTSLISASCYLPPACIWFTGQHGSVVASRALNCDRGPVGHLGQTCSQPPSPRTGDTWLGPFSFQRPH